MTRPPAVLFLAVAASLALAACGGGSTPAAGGSSTAPPSAAPTEAAAPTDAGSAAPANDATPAAGGALDCATLLPADEAAAIVGVTPEPVEERTFPGSTECYYPYAADGAAVQDFLQVILDTNAADVSTWSGLQGAEADSDSATPTSIDGIGDESFTWVGQGDYRKLYVRRGDTTLILRFDANLPALFSEAQMIDFADRLFGRAS